MTARRASCLTSLVWIGLIGASAILFCPESSSSPKLSLDEFERSGFSEWVSLPHDSKEIFADFYGGFDTNYRTVLFHHRDPEPKEIIRRSISLNSQHHEEELSWLEDRIFSLEGLFEVFRYGEESFPSWWVQSMSGTTPVATVAFWERDGYGYGYLIVVELTTERVRILQFSQQHLKFDYIRRAFTQPAQEGEPAEGGKASPATS